MNHKTLTTAVGVIAMGLVVVFAATWVPSFIAMILLGILHGYNEQIPAIGFWQTFCWFWLIGLVGAVFTGRGSQNSR